MIAKLLLTILTLNFPLSDILLVFYAYFIHFEIYHIISPPHTLQFVIFVKITN